MRILNSLIFALLALVSIAGVAGADTSYKLRPGDTLEVTVWQEPKLNRNVVVAPDGRISFPLVGTVRAGGRSVESVQAAIKNGLAKQYTTDIDVTVGIAGIKEEPPAAEEPPLYPSIYVTGEVARPGKYEYRQSVNVLQAIALAGGLSPFAADKRIKIRRKTNGEERLYDFDYDAFTSGEDMSGNIVLKGGDVVIVPERKLFE